MSTHIEQVAHERTRRYLVGLSDRTLEDMGFSRELLEQGPKAWPWRMPEDTDSGHELVAQTQGVAAEAEPQAPAHRPSLAPAVRITQPAFEIEKAA